MVNIHTTVSPTNRLLGKCAACTRPVGLDDDGPADYRTVDCPECGALVRLERVYGTVSRMACAGECESAIGPVCSCACGGQNHGGKYLQTGTALVSAIERFRELTEVRKVAAEKRAAKAAEKRRRTAVEKAEQEAAERAAFMEEHADLWAFLVANTLAYDEFYGSLRGYWESKGFLTERQVEALTTAIRKSAERAERKAVEAANAKPAPLGKQSVEGTVLHVRDQEGYAGGTEWKMLVGCDGYKVWATVPQAIRDAHWQSHTTASVGSWLTGRIVRFTATLEASRDGDESFVFAKRPRTAVVLEPVAA